jgi:signal transduction histidine kinase
MASVLIIDDEPGIRTTLALFLRAAGHQVEEAATVGEAREALRRGSFDVVVTDVILPGASGVELLKLLRRQAPELPVIMMTGQPTAESAAEALRAGAVDYLFKPITKEMILAAIDRASLIKALREERRKLVAATEHYRKNLEHLVEQRTRALRDSNERLQAALKELEETQAQVLQQERLTALGQMASGVAHDFNNTLTPILGFTEIILNNIDRMPREEIAKKLKIVRAAALNAADIIARLREFYRAPSSRDMIQVVDLNQVLEEAIAMTQPRWRDQALARGVQIQVERDLQPLPPVQGNASELCEAVINLIFNAVDAMPAGGRLCFRTRVEEKTVCLEIEDNGVGMDPESVQRCMDPFFTTKGERGTGLGLAVTYGIIKRHSGRISVESRLGMGTTFTIHLPISRLVERVKSEEGAPTVRPLRILVVEDEALIRETIREYLRPAGHELVLACNGRQGWELFRQSRFDLVITDRAMPELGGDELAARIRCARPDQPIILLSGGVDQLGPDHATRRNVDVVIGKPLAIHDLYKAIATAMGRAETAGDDAEAASPAADPVQASGEQENLAVTPPDARAGGGP